MTKAFVSRTTVIHGRVSTYGTHRCRCEPCRAAKRQAKARYEAMRRERDGTHRGGRRRRPRHFTLDELEARLSSTTALAERLGISVRRLYRLRRSGLTDVQADELASRVDLHPADVWDSTWWTSSEA